MNNDTDIEITISRMQGVHKYVLVVVCNELILNSQFVFKQYYIDAFIVFLLWQRRPKNPSGQSHVGRLFSSSVQTPSFSQTRSAQVLESKFLETKIKVLLHYLDVYSHTPFGDRPHTHLYVRLQLVPIQNMCSKFKFKEIIQCILPQ